MKKIVSLAAVALFLTGFYCLTPFSVSAQTGGAIAKRTDETLNNDSIVQMVNTGLSESIIIAKIKSSGSSFDTSATALQSLKKQGVSDTVILAMVQKASGMEVATNAPTVSSVNAAGGSFVIPDGTEIKIVTLEDISGQKVVEGDPLTFKIAEDVKINGTTVIAKDAIVKGTVSSAKKKGMMGKSGELSIRIESTQSVDGQKVKLRASKAGKGGDNMGSTVALTVLFGPLGLLRHGKEAKIKSGTILSAFTDESKTVSISN